MISKIEKNGKPERLKEELRLAKLEAKELRAQLASTYSFASKELQKCGDVRGGGVMVELTFLGGRPACMPFVIRDGLSKETIKALESDMCRSYALATEMKPKNYLLQE